MDLTLNLTLTVLTFIVGTAFGSAINALVFRLRTGLPLFKDRSICPDCHRKLKTEDLVPIISYISLRGRCRYCGKPISLQYPLVELATGLLFMGTFVQYFSLSTRLDIDPATVVTFFAQLFFITILLILLLYDLKHMELPDKILIPGIILAAAVDLAKFGVTVWEFRDVTGKLPLGKYLLANPDFVQRHILDMATPLLYGALAGLVLAAIFYLIVVISRERAMGGGDIKLAVLLGLVLPWPYLVPALYVGFVLGALVGVGLVVLRRKKIKSLIPLGPFLVAGTIAAMFFGSDLLRFLFPFKLF
jgi:leader peptidase (prepilin peptidase)/N-methyltransferase